MLWMSSWMRTVLPTPVDELLDEHRLAHPGAAEQADLAAPGVGGQQVDDLDARLKQVHHGARMDHRS